MKVSKRITAIMIIFMMLFSYIAPVMAVSTETFTVKRSATRGDYEYWLSDKRVNKFTVNGYDAAYCMHAEADFLASSYEYNRAYNMKLEEDINAIKEIDWGTNKITQAKKRVTITKNYKVSDSGAPAYLQPVLEVKENDSGDIQYSNYNAVLWILDNMFVPTEDTKKNKEFKKQLFEDAYADAIEHTNLDINSINITNADIQVVQQWALWYFTNSSDSKYHVTALPTVKVKDSAGNITTINALNQDGRKQKHLNTLYVYFIENAMKNASKYGYSGDRKVKSNYTTKAYLCAVKGKYSTQQPIVKIIREIPTKNKYNVVVRKYNSATGEIINSKMQISMVDPTGDTSTKTVKGSTNVGQYDITDITENDKIYIKEVSAPSGFQKLNGGITLNITKKIYGGTYSLSKVTTKYDSKDDKNYIDVKLVTLEDIDTSGGTETISTIYVDIYDKTIEAGFNFNIKKVDADTGDLIYAPANFEIVRAPSEITGKTKATTRNGIADFGEQTIKSEANKLGTFLYYIRENTSPISYQGLDRNKLIELSVTTALNDSSEEYYVANASVKIVDASTGAILEENPEGIEVEVKDGKEISLTIPNQRIDGQYYIFIQKVDQDNTSVQLEGANFSATLGTGDNAESVGEGMGFVYNTYSSETDVHTFTEIQTPDGYISLSAPVKVYVDKVIDGSDYVVSNVTTDSPEVVDIVVNNNQILLKIKNKKLQGSYQLQIQKQDENGNNIDGASFMVSYPNNLVDSFTYNDKVSNPYQLVKQEIYEEGKDEWVITETGSPEGYVRLEKDIYVSVTKFLDTTNNRWDISDIQIKDQDGNDISNEVLLERDDENNLFTIKIVNKKIEGNYKIYYAKEDSLTGERIYSSDTTFNITRNNQDSETINLAVGMKIVGPFEIQTNGQVDTYVIEEVKAPEGYKKIKDPITFKIHTYEMEGKYVPYWVETDSEYIDTYIGQTGIVYITVNNDKITGNYQLDLLKIDADTKEQINGAKFEIKYPGDTEYTEIKFEEGDFLTPPISMTEEGIDYIYIREIETPEGYVELSEELKLEVTKAIQNEQIIVQQIKITNANDSAAPEGTEVNLKNNSTIEVKVPNKQKEGTYNLEIIKYNEDGSKLSDAEFTVIMPDGTSKIITTNSEGRAQIGNVEITSVGIDEFIIKETKAPEGYTPLSEEFKVKVSKVETDNGYHRGDIEIINNNIQNIEYFTRGSQIQISVTNKEMTEYDLSLRKFITLVNDVGPEVSREPVVDTSKLVDGSSTTSTYTHTKDPLLVANTDVVVYTLRMYNEGISSAYVAEVKDDIPLGLEFIVDNEINKKYGWKMYDELGNETTDVEKAKTIKTEYLSKEQSEARQEDNLLKPFEYNNDSKLDYRDVLVAFKVNSKEALEDRIIINTAEITKETDENGEDVSDRDSTPDNGKENEDDIDKEYLKLKYFDLALLKWVSSATVIENTKITETLTGHTGLENPEPVVKVELHRKKLDQVVVKFGYTIKITNEGQIEGYASEISDYIPEGLKFVAEDNPEWSEKDGKIVTRQLENTLLKPGESAEVTVILTWINGEDNLDLKTNIAEISEDFNSYEEEDIDSTPNNQVEGEDDIDDAPVLLTIATGKAKVYIILTIAVMTTLASGIVLIKKFVI